MTKQEAMAQRYRFLAACPYRTDQEEDEVRALDAALATYWGTPGAVVRVPICQREGA